MAKPLSGFQEFLLSLVFPAFLSYGGSKFLEVLEKAYLDNPKLIETALVSLYPLVDVYLEKFVADSKTKLDDKGVAELKQVIETFAAAHEIVLPNLDTD